jgi:hypothetical protein
MRIDGVQTFGNLGIDVLRAIHLSLRLLLSPFMSVAGLGIGVDTLWLWMLLPGGVVVVTRIIISILLRLAALRFITIKMALGKGSGDDLSPADFVQSMIPESIKAAFRALAEDRSS